MFEYLNGVSTEPTTPGKFCSLTAQDLHSSDDGSDPEELIVQCQRLEEKFADRTRAVQELDRNAYRRMITPHIKIFADSVKPEKERGNSASARKQAYLIDVERQHCNIVPRKDSEDDVDEYEITKSNPSWRQRLFRRLLATQDERLTIASRVARARSLFRRKNPAEVNGSVDHQTPSLTRDMIELIRNAFDRPHSAIVTSVQREHITRADLETLCGLNWLNDSIINAYVALIEQRSKRCSELPNVFAFNSFFLTSYAKSGYKSVRRWTRRSDIFNEHIVLVPVHLGMHWCLAVIDFRERIIKYMDSLGGKNDKCLNTILEYLVEEHREKRGRELGVDGWSLANIKGLPQQENGSDCGVFAMKYADYYTMEAPINFHQTDMPYFRRRMMVELLQGDLFYRTCVEDHVAL